MRKVRVPAHRYTPLKENWEALMAPIVGPLKLQIRMNTRSRTVELKVRRLPSAVCIRVFACCLLVSVVRMQRVCVALSCGVCVIV